MCLAFTFKEDIMGKFGIILIAVTAVGGGFLGYNLGWVGFCIAIPLGALAGFVGARLDRKYE